VTRIDAAKTNSEVAMKNKNAYTMLSAAMSVALGCGARTGLSVRNVTLASNPPGTFMVRGNGQCGLCFREPFAIRRTNSSAGYSQEICSLSTQNGDVCDPVGMKNGDEQHVVKSSPDCGV